ncbi:CHAP domain-containing protein [Palleronia abyssalis]|uniref:Peptidase C51 domain-containing protein n=1 Tax=Palleronia abyssalis TaxID=1501240 RepID=A0A2R8BRE2_9RHOB|nr:CHAP domain-containing protein [Palleronia abyssalis]SPJ22743.1 hypothetical protein PAA8504_00541 [Palleronia abyssalis]
MLKAHEAAFDAALPWVAEARRFAVEGLAIDRPHPGPHQPVFRWVYGLNRVTPLRLPWCGLFVAHCLRRSFGEIPLPRGHARARPWMGWADPSEPQIGAVMVFWHYHPRLPFGHVAFYVAEDDTAFHVLGGNQLNKVCIMRYPKVRLLDCRWPGGPVPTGQRIFAPPGHAHPFG